MIGSLLQADFEELIAAKDWNTLHDVLVDLDAADIAELIIDVPPEVDGIIFRMLPRARAAEVFEHLPPDQQKEMCYSLNSAELQSVVNQMTPDDRTRLLEQVPASLVRQILDTLSPTELHTARQLLGFPEGTAGRYMTPEYVALPPDITAAEALNRIRHTGRGKETLNVIYIIDPRGKLLEDLKLGTLVLANEETMIGDIEERAIVSIPATTQLQDIIPAFERYDRVALPVVDNDGIMLGIVTHDDVLEFAQESATREMQQLGGSEALDAPYLQVGFWDMVKKRGVWLSVLFLGEMLTASAMGHFEHDLEKAAVIALFIPLIISSGGNSGSQCTSFMIRSLALKEVLLKDWWRVFGRELRTGLTLGVFLGAIGFARIAAWQGLSHVPHIGTAFQSGSAEAMINGVPTAYGQHWALLGITVFITLIGVVTWGSLSGSMLPFILRRFGLDPATSSAPFVATLVDVTGLVIYFVAAKVVLTGTLL